MADFEAIATAIGKSTGRPFILEGRQHAGGGCINRAAAIRGKDSRRFFVKLNAARLDGMFAAEAEGLREMEATQAVRVPHPVAHGVAGDSAFLALEWLDLGGRGDAAELGRQLCAMHRVTTPTFGWHRDNTIGATPQENTPSHDWIGFWRERRLGPQLGLTRHNRASSRLLGKGEQLLDKLHVFFPGYTPLPSLLHGDLWSGNFGFCQGQAVLFDPAVYFGDREADMAMTELFGGFPADFYAAYRESWPLDPGYPARRQLYNLYHVLNHFNLFGGGYAQQAERILDGLLAECA